MNEKETKAMTETMKVLSEVGGERSAQEKKWGQQNHKPIEWIAILTEEVGEAAKEAVDWNLSNGIYYKLIRYREELIQTAAVAVAMIESLDRNELKKIK